MLLKTSLGEDITCNKWNTTSDLFPQVYHVMSQLDQDLTGQLDYNKFLGELFRPMSQSSSRASSRGLLPLSRQSLRQSVMLESRAARSRQSIA